MQILDRLYTPEKLVKGRHTSKRYRNLSFIAKITISKELVKRGKAKDKHKKFLADNEDKIKAIQKVLREPYADLKTKDDAIVIYQGRELSFKKVQERLGITAYSLLAICYCDRHSDWSYKL